MKCEEFESWMIDYLDNKLDDQKKKEIEKHLETCEKCLDYLTDSQKILNLFSGQEMEKPDETLRINFYHMLHNEVRRSAEGLKETYETQKASWFYNKPFLVAAGIAVLVCGVFFGMLIHSRMTNSMNSGRIDYLQAQVTGLRKDAFLTMLKEESSSNRLQGVSYADQLEQPDDMVIEALLKTLNTDRNVNVRLAAAYSLSKFTGERMVCDSLVASLPKQTDPILQVTLINILVGIRETSALSGIQQIIQSENTITEVKAVAEKGAKELML